MRRIQSQSKTIGDIRGKGLMLAAEFVKNKETKQPCPDSMMRVFDQMSKRKILFGKGGMHKNVIRIQPPMCLTEADVDYTLCVLQDIIKTEGL